MSVSKNIQLRAEMEIDVVNVKEYSCERDRDWKMIERIIPHC